MAMFEIDQRERLANKLLMQGSASMDEVLYASFGAWPPNGLEIVGENNQRVNFMSLWQMCDRRNEKNEEKHRIGLFGKLKENFIIAGRATLTDERIIGISKATTVAMSRFESLIKGNLWAAVTGNADSIRTTIAHESAHILQGDHYWRAKEMFGHENSQTIWRGQKDASSNTIAKDVFNAHTKPPGMLTRLFNMVSGSLGTEYYKQGIEIQARMQEVIADGYQRWGTLPCNRAELYAACENAGLKVPQRYLDEIQNSPMCEDIEIIFQSKKSGGKAASASSDINFTMKLLTPEGQDKFWDQTIPALYSDLIEMYGDGPGRERFGLGVNPRREMRESAEFVAAQNALKTARPQQTQPA